MVRVLLAIALLSTTASADRGPRFAIGLDYSVGHGGRVEALDLGTRLEGGLFLRLGRWQATLSIPAHPTIESDHPQRDGVEPLVGLGVSGRLAYRAPFLGGVLSFAGGMTRRWIYAEQDVRRYCREIGDCIAGSYLARPSYTAWAPQVRIGVGGDKPFTRMVMGVQFEVIVEAIGLADVPPDGVRGVAVQGAVTFTVGGGPRRAARAEPVLVGQNL